MCSGKGNANKNTKKERQIIVCILTYTEKNLSKKSNVAISKLNAFLKAQFKFLFFNK